jgi:hypothetical protein
MFQLFLHVTQEHNKLFSLLCLLLHVQVGGTCSVCCVLVLHVKVTNTCSVYYVFCYQYKQLEHVLFIVFLCYITSTCNRRHNKQNIFQLFLHVTQEYNKQNMFQLFALVTQAHNKQNICTNSWNMFCFLCSSVTCKSSWNMFCL